MLETIETFVVKIAGDVTDFKNGMDEAIRQAELFKETTKELGGNLKGDFETAGANIKEFAGSLTDYQSSYEGLLKLNEDMAASFDKFNGYSDTVSGIADQIRGWGDALNSSTLAPKAAEIVDSISKGFKDVGDLSQYKDTIEDMITKTDGFKTAVQDMGKNLQTDFSGIGDSVMEFAGSLTSVQSGYEGALKLTEDLAGACQNISQYGSTFTDMGESIRGWGEALGSEVVLPKIADFFDGIGEGFEKVGAFGGFLSTLGASVADVVTNVGDMISTVGSLAEGLKEIPMVDEIFSKFSQVLGGIPGPVQIVIGVIAALVALFITLYNTNEEFREKVQEIWGEICEYFSGVFESIKEIAETIFEELKSFWEEWGETIMATFEAAWETISELFEGAVELIWTAVETVFNALQEFWDEWGETIMATFEAAWELVTTLFEGAVELIWTTVETVFNALQEFWDEWGETIIATFEAAWELVTTLFEGAVELIWTTVETVFNALQEFWDEWGETIMEIFSTVWDNITVIFETVMAVLQAVFKIFEGIFTGDWDTFWEGISSLFTAIIEGIKKIFQNTLNLILSIATTIFVKLKKAIVDKMEEVLESISDILTSIKEFFLGLPAEALEWGKNLIGGFIDGIMAMAAQVGEAVSGVISNVKGFLGFNSPAKKGEGRYIVDWGYNMIGGFMDGIDKALPELERSMAKVIPDMDIAVGKMNTPGIKQYGGQKAFGGMMENQQPAKTEITVNTEGLFKGASLTVRNDSDIDKIARLVVERLSDTLIKANRTNGLQYI